MIKSSNYNKAIEIQGTSVRMHMKREDLIHPFISGNKYRKLIFNVKRANEIHSKTLLTFGGAFSNHIAAVAFAGKESGFKTIGIIRGDELKFKTDLNPTLVFAHAHGMHLKFISRAEYKQKTDPNYIQLLRDEFGDFYLIPEGGTNALAIKGCEEILQTQDLRFDYICSAVGTGGTIAGLINASQSHQKILGFPALKGDFLEQDIRKFVTKDNWELVKDYHFGGYGKIKPELIAFINSFKRDHNIPLDPIYTGKMMFGLFDLIKN